MKTATDSKDVLMIINAEHNNPFDILGMHVIDLEKDNKALVVRTFLPNAGRAYVVDLDSETQTQTKTQTKTQTLTKNKCENKSVYYEMTKIHENGFFEVIIQDCEKSFNYNIEIVDSCGNIYRIFDPYCFSPMLSEYDLYLFNEGKHHKIYEKLGAHIKTINGIKGTIFAVWAPCAKHVSVVGDFNKWDGRCHQMLNRKPFGVWELFIPGITNGQVYKFEIKTANNDVLIKADPYAFYSELRPDTASIVYDLENYNWNDDQWMVEREKGGFLEKPISIYEVHLGSWDRISIGDDDQGPGRFLTYIEFADRLVKYVKDMEYTHIELLPVTEHPFDGSWGYQVTGYYAITSRFGKPEEFMYFVDKCHQENIGVIIDWVPAHFPKDGHGLARFDGTALYEHYDPRQGEQLDWGTYVFNYGRPEVKNFLVSNAMFWCEKYHIDGFRVDAVASMLYLDYGKTEGQWIKNKWGGRENLEAVDFLKQLNTTVFEYYKGVMMIAEESTSWPLVSKPAYMGGLGFSFKWNMGWMNDYLKYLSTDPIYRKYSHDKLTFSIMYAFSENFILVLSHDEVVHGKYSMINKMPGEYKMKFAGLRISYGYMYAHPGKKLLFMGGEFGQFIEWNHDKRLDWHLLDYEMHNKLQKYVKDLNKLYKTEKALYEIDFDNDGFEWIDCSDSDHSVVSFMRKSKEEHDFLLIVCNFTPVEYSNYRIGAPYYVFYKEIFNSDSDYYGGSNIGNFGGKHAEKKAFHKKEYSLNIQIPPLSILIFKPVFGNSLISDKQTDIDKSSDTDIKTDTDIDIDIE